MDDTWVHHFELESKWQSLVWRHLSSPTAKHFKTDNAAGKLMTTILCNMEAPVFVNFTPTGKIVNRRTIVSCFYYWSQKSRPKDMVNFQRTLFYFRTTLDLILATKQHFAFKVVVLSCWTIPIEFLRDSKQLLSFWHIETRTTSIVLTKR